MGAVSDDRRTTAVIQKTLWRTRAIPRQFRAVALARFWLGGFDVMDFSLSPDVGMLTLTDIRTALCCTMRALKRSGLSALHPSPDTVSTVMIRDFPLEINVFPQKADLTGAVPPIARCSRSEARGGPVWRKIGLSFNIPCEPVRFHVEVNNVRIGQNQNTKIVRTVDYPSEAFWKVDKYTEGSYNKSHTIYQSIHILWDDGIRDARHHGRHTGGADQ